MSTSFREFRSGQEFADVTLVCEDGKKIEAHKMILSSASKFFKHALTENKHSHPMIYMRGVKARYLESVVDFIYHGESNIDQEDLNSFLQLAGDLELKGLAGGLKESEWNDIFQKMCGH